MTRGRFDSSLCLCLCLCLSLSLSYSLSLSLTLLLCYSVTLLLSLTLSLSYSLRLPLSLSLFILNSARLPTRGHDDASLSRSRRRTFQRNPAIWLNSLPFHEEKESSCCFASRSSHGQLQNTEEAFFVRCRTAPSLCAPGSMFEPMNSRERSHLVSCPQVHVALHHLSAPVCFVQKDFKACLAEGSAAVRNHAKEALLLENSSTSPVYWRQDKPHVVASPRTTC